MEQGERLFIFLSMATEPVGG